MKILQSFVIAALLAVPTTAAAQTPTPVADPIGTWNASFNTQNGVIPATLKFQKTGEKITGTIASDQGPNELEAEVKGKTLTVWFTYNANGQAIPIEMTGTIDGDSAKGTMTAGGNAAGDWTATRAKDTKDTKDTKGPAPAPSTPSTPSYPSLSGDWTMTLQLDQVNATPALTLKQDGEKLTGTYTSQQYGKFPLTGTVKGNDVNFSVTLNIDGNSITGTYAGKVQADGTIAGSVDIGGMMSGSFTATRAK
jgi:hypothetical protein